MDVGDKTEIQQERGEGNLFKERWYIKLEAMLNKLCYDLQMDGFTMC